MHRILMLLLLIVGVLVGCTATPATLPLAEDQPTFFFFYTDG